MYVCKPLWCRVGGYWQTCCIMGLNRERRTKPHVDPKGPCHIHIYIYTHISIYVHVYIYTHMYISIYVQMVFIPKLPKPVSARSFSGLGSSSSLSVRKIGLGS